VGEKEREHDLTSLRKEIATLVAEKCVEPSTQRPYAVGMIEKAMAEAGFSVKQNKSAKSQVGDMFFRGISFKLVTKRSLSVSSCCSHIPNCRYNVRGCALR
jgi:ribosome maturation protein Sdo1